MIKVKMIGDFQVSASGVTLEEKDFRSNTLIRMFTYIILNRSRLLKREELIEHFCQRSTKTPEGTLKNLIYRMRVVLKQLGEEEFIESISGGYRWNPDIGAKVDLEDYHRLADILSEEEDEGVLRELCRKSLTQYGEHFSLKLSQEEWLRGQETWYRHTRLETAKKLCNIFRNNKNWEELEELAADMLKSEALDEDLHCYMLESYRGREQFDKAIHHYERAEKLLSDAYNGNRPAKLQQAYMELLELVERYTRSLNTVMTEMKEEEKPLGAYFCDYDTFRQVYQVSARRANREEDMDVNMLLLTVSVVNRSWYKDPKTEKEILKKGMDALTGCFRDFLRMGDVVARCSDTQYAVLLSHCTLEDAKGVAKRIQESFFLYDTDKGVQITCEAGEIHPTLWQKEALDEKLIG